MCACFYMGFVCVYEGKFQSGDRRCGWGSSLTTLKQGHHRRSCMTLSPSCSSLWGLIILAGAPLSLLCGRFHENTKNTTPKYAVSGSRRGEEGWHESKWRRPRETGIKRKDVLFTASPNLKGNMRKSCLVVDTTGCGHHGLYAKGIKFQRCNDENRMGKVQKFIWQMLPLLHVMVVAYRFHLVRGFVVAEMMCCQGASISCSMRHCACLCVTSVESLE